MRINLLWIGLPVFLGVMSGCGESDLDKDGVPKIDVHGRAIVKQVKALSVGVPVYQDREFRVVSFRGKDMDLGEFINTYCPGKEMTNSTCSRAIKIHHIDRMGSRDGKLRQLPPGL